MNITDQADKIVNKAMTEIEKCPADMEQIRNILDRAVTRGMIEATDAAISIINKGQP